MGEIYPELGVMLLFHGGICFRMKWKFGSVHKSENTGLSRNYLNQKREYCTRTGAGLSLRRVIVIQNYPRKSKPVLRPSWLI